MKLSHLLIGVAFAAASLAGCQQEQPAATEPQADAPTTDVASQVPANGAASACAVIAHRQWEAILSTRQDGSSTLTVSGQVDLPRPGYSVSLVRDSSGSSPANEPHLSLMLTPSSQPSDAAVTPHPVYYFAPASGQYTTVHIDCEGAPLTDINVATGP